MIPKTESHVKTQLLILAFSGFVVTALFLYFGRYDFRLWDEGYLWYGVQQVLKGGVPIRDFMAYDPGRYYWSAALMSAWGRSDILSLRATMAVFQALGLFAALMLIMKSAKGAGGECIIYLLLSTAVLVAWMFPRQNLYDISLSIFLVAILAYLIEKPLPERYLVAGLGVGLVAVFGRNHGVYGAAGSLGAMLWLNVGQNRATRPIRDFFIWASGVTVGFSPIFIMALIYPGFASAFWRSVCFDLTLPGKIHPSNILLPWKVHFSTVPANEAIREVLIGSFVVFVVVFGILSLLWVFRQRVRNRYVSPSFAAASLMTIPYMHPVYWAPGLRHLSQSVFPFLIGCLILLRRQPAGIKWPLAVLFAAICAWTVYPYQSGSYCHLNADYCTRVKVSGDDIVMGNGTARQIALFRDLAKRFAPDGRAFIAAPFLPGAYAVLDRKSPMWDIYAFFPRTKKFQEQEISRIKAANPGFAVVLDIALWGNEKMRFRNSHAYVYRYLERHFDRLHYPDPNLEIFRAKAAGQ